MKNYFEIKSLEEKAGSFQMGPLSLSLEKGEYLVLLGPTGCGKTTLLKSIAGISQGSGKGRIFFQGDEIGKLPPHKRRIGYVSQKSDLFPHLNVKDNIAFGLKYLDISSEEKNARLYKYIKMLDIESLIDRMPQGLSGGEGRRVAMARSLVIEPRILLLDEPLGMLDHNGRMEMLKILRMIHEEIATTTIHVTHDRKEAWEISSTCAIMNKGKIIQEGSVENVFRGPETFFVADFLGGRNIFRAEFNDGRVKIEWGDFPVKGVKNNSSGWIMIRPESISLSKKNSEDSMKMEIIAIRDQGDFLEIEARAGLKNRLIINSTLPGRDATLKPGDIISPYWDDNSLHVIYDDMETKE
jgi:ABC-type Fe3+/spermidine/putrescine transport system ATPase subunit